MCLRDCHSGHSGFDLGNRCANIPGFDGALLLSERLLLDPSRHSGQVQNDRFEVFGVSMTQKFSPLRVMAESAR